jgi:hypothetical protein
MPHPSQPATAEPTSSPAHPTADPAPAKKPRGNSNLHLAPAQRARGRDRRGTRTRSGCPRPRPRDPPETPLPHAWRPQYRPPHPQEPAPAEAGGLGDLRAVHAIHGNAGVEARRRPRKTPNPRFRESTP